ncbi:MAG: Fur family transcriptional regulator [Parvularcula sp.]
MSGDSAAKTADPTDAREEDAPSGSEARLTRNERLVLDVLSGQSGPMKAYELLAALKDHGIKAPMTVYRALDRLEAKGLIHKMDAMNAFLVCNHDTPHPVQTFLVCAACNQVKEIQEHGVTGLTWSALQGVAGDNSFRANSARLEIRGICDECA